MKIQIFKQSLPRLLGAAEIPPTYWQDICQLKAVLPLREYFCCILYLYVLYSFYLQYLFVYILKGLIFCIMGKAFRGPSQRKYLTFVTELRYSAPEVCPAGLSHFFIPSPCMIINLNSALHYITFHLSGNAGKNTYMELIYLF